MNRSSPCAALLTVLLLVTGSSFGKVTIQGCPGGGYLPDALAAPDGTVHLLFHRGDPAHCDLYYARWSPSDQSFSDPVRINSMEGAGLAVGSVRGAHLALGKDDAIHVAWMGSARTAPEGDHARTPMCYTRSQDGGRTYEPQRSLTTSAYGLDGGGSVAADKDGNVFVLWHAMGADHDVANRIVVAAVSRNNGETFAAERTIDTNGSGVCPCCGMRAAADPASGETLVLFRSAAKPDQRDMNLFVLDQDKDQARLIHRDPWQIESCPVSSGSFAFGPEKLAVAWETDHRIRVHVMARDSHKVLRSLEAPPPLQGAHQKHGSVALGSGGTLAAAWLETKGWGRPGILRWQVFDSAGSKTERAGQKQMDAPWTRPALVRVGLDFVLFY